MALVQLALPGPVYLYNGDELGLPNVELPGWTLQDPIRRHPRHTERLSHGCLVPLPSEGYAPPCGFTDTPGSSLPTPGDWANLTVASQLEDPDSMLSLYRRALELRSQHARFCLRRAEVVRRAVRMSRIPPQARRVDMRAVRRCIATGKCCCPLVCCPTAATCCLPILPSGSSYESASTSSGGAQTPSMASKYSH